MKNGYQIHTTESSNPVTQGILGKVKQHYQFVPNALGALAESPESVLAYLALDDLVQKNAFTDTERHIVFLTITREYDCEYCVAAHTAFAQMGKVEDEIVMNIREGKALADPHLEALRQFSIKLVQTGCHVKEDDIQHFLEQGFTRRHVLDIVTMMANKLIAIFSNRIMGTDLDEMLQPASWSRVA